MDIELTDAQREELQDKFMAYGGTGLTLLFGGLAVLFKSNTTAVAECLTGAFTTATMAGVGWKYLWDRKQINANNPVPESNSDFDCS